MIYKLFECSPNISRRLKAKESVVYCIKYFEVKRAPTGKIIWFYYRGLLSKLIILKPIMTQFDLAPNFLKTQFYQKRN